MHPLVSVIIPVYNGERFLTETLVSVRAQDYAGGFDTIVVDDGSTDSTAAIAQAVPGVRYFHQSNRGNAAARNHGISVARGELLAFLDDDDLWLPQKTRVQVGWLAAHPELDFVNCNCSLRFDPGVDPDPPAYRGLPRVNFPSYVPSGLLARGSAFAKIGLFEEALRLSADTDWFFRASDARLPSAIVPEVLFEKRIHGSNLSAQVPALRRELFDVLRRSVQRKRAASPA